MRQHFGPASVCQSRPCRVSLGDSTPTRKPIPRLHHCLRHDFTLCASFLIPPQHSQSWTSGLLLAAAARRSHLWTRTSAPESQGRLIQSLHTHHGSSGGFRSGVKAAVWTVVPPASLLHTLPQALLLTPPLCLPACRCLCCTCVRSPRCYCHGCHGCRTCGISCGTGGSSGTCCSCQ